MTIEPAFSPELLPEEREIIAEELEILERLREHLAAFVPQFQDLRYEQALLELRDSLTTAAEDEVAQIVAQMDSLSRLSDHQNAARDLPPVDLDSPYFGHLRVSQEGRVRDVLIGNQSLTTGHIPVPIIDWRNAPISRIFYAYREGEEYDEELGGRDVEGEILAHRRLMILSGQLLRIECLQGVYQLQGQAWEKVTGGMPVLEGGEGAAVRGGSLAPIATQSATQSAAGNGAGQQTLALGGAGAHLGAELRQDKRLQLITGLLDEEQFELITRPDSGVVVIDGGAGSGKTTIALHRMAYLAFNNPQRFSVPTMLCVVFTPALAAYISQLLAALGLDNARVEVFEDFMATLRRRHFTKMQVRVSQSTPSAVLRFKQHPVALQVLERRVAALADELRTGFAEALSGDSATQACLAAWDTLADRPVAARLAEYLHWVAGKATLPGVGKFTHGWVPQQRLFAHLTEDFQDAQEPNRLVWNLWMQALFSLDQLAADVEELAPGEFTRQHLAEVRDRAIRFHSEWEDYLASKEEPAEKPDPEDLEAGEVEEAIEPPYLDPEDDTLLLLLYRMMVGPLRSRRSRSLRVQHLTVDEAQDFSPLDLRVLLDLAEEPLSVTLAGDTDQRMILYNSFTRWEDVLDQLGLESTAIKPLQVGYRATAEIMDFARGVLGPLASERPWHAVRQGAPVLLLRSSDRGQAVALLADRLLDLIRREPHANVALIARHPAQADLYHEGLHRADLPRLRRVRNYEFSFAPGVEVTDVAQVKGLEFDYVVLLDVDRATYPDDDASRYLLHIGATRAAHQLWLLTTEQASPLVPPEMQSVLL